MIEVKEEQLEKAESPIEVTLFPIVTEVKEAQPLKAPYPIEVTLFGIAIEVKEEQLKKAEFPIEVTPFPIVTVVKDVHPEKAPSPIEVTLSGIIVEAQPTINLLVKVSFIALQLFLESYTVFPSSTIIEVKEVQPEKAPSSIEVTLFGITIEVKELHK